MAFGLPGSQFLGLDLAAKPLEGARALAANLGLRNIEFRCADILDLGPELGEFDYIVVPGLYSWVPEEVRDQLLKLCGQCLAPQGVAIVSYNAYPGAYMSTMVREMIDFHTRSIADPQTQIRQGRGLLNVLARSQTEPTAFKLALDQELKRIANYDDGVFFHDDLNPHYHPVFFHQFVTHAQAHDLQYLGERCENVLDPEQYPAEIRGPLRRLAECGTVEREQYLDFIHRRRFRCTFLCRDDVSLDQERGLECVSRLLVGISKDMKVNVLVEPGVSVRFETDGETLASTSHPLLIAAVAHLLEVRPAAVPLAELLQAAEAQTSGVPFPEGGPQDNGALLEAFVLRCHLTRLLDLGTWQPHLQVRPSERPVASALARAKITSNPLVPSLRHDAVAILDDRARELFVMLDGSRDRSQLLRELNAAHSSDTPVTAAMLEEKLLQLAQLALLSE
jgi:SAM-dependent methyltransferase